MSVFAITLESPISLGLSYSQYLTKFFDFNLKIHRNFAITAKKLAIRIRVASGFRDAVRITPQTQRCAPHGPEGHPARGDARCS